METVKQIGLEAPVPWIVGECASSCLAVLTNPMHKMYGKVNKFLQKAPSWEPEKIPSYWIDKIFLNEPELDDGYFDETSWLLDLLIKGLRTEAVCYLPSTCLFVATLLINHRIWIFTAARMSSREHSHSTSRLVQATLPRERSCSWCIARPKYEEARRWSPERGSSAGSKVRFRS